VTGLLFDVTQIDLAFFAQINHQHWRLQAATLLRSSFSALATGFCQ
jgi:hypothetical protein